MITKAFRSRINKLSSAYYAESSLSLSKVDCSRSLAHNQALERERNISCLRVFLVRDRGAVAFDLLLLPTAAIHYKRKP